MNIIHFSIERKLYNMYKKKKNVSELQRDKDGEGDR